MRLIVDDDDRRYIAVAKAYGWSTMARAVDMGLAIREMLVDRYYTHIYMDHDGVDGDLLAQWMARHKPHLNAKILIHSANVVGSQMMYDTLKAAGYDVEQVRFEDVVK